mmetsp:Transcript_17652/g.49438  ORF Transcript_17652/g.49438 Transcript_17652/m.49438 type:complete len:121 (-) Transcript_17652:2057-2419(-)
MSILRLNERRLVGPPRVATAGAATDASMGGVTNSVEASTLDDCSALGWGSFSPSPPGALGDPGIVDALSPAIERLRALRSWREVALTPAVSSDLLLSLDARARRKHPEFARANCAPPAPP